MAESEYAQHSKCCGLTALWVRVPPCPLMEMENQNPEIADIKTPIESISRATWDYIKEKYGRKATTAILLIAGMVAVDIFILQTTIITIILLGTAFIVYGRIYSKVDNRFYEQIAEVNGYGYEPKGYVEAIGHVFQIGDSRKFEDIISGTFENHSLKLFVYSFTTGSGKHRVTHKLSICELTFPTKTPNIVLNAKNFSSYSLFDFKLDKLKLEGDFHKYFTLYCEPGYEIEALQIFTPDIMQDFIDKSRAYDVEFIKDKVYIMSPRSLKTRSEISFMFGFAHHLISKLKTVLPRIKI